MRIAYAFAVAAVVFSLTVSAQKKVADSKTTYAKEVLQPYVDSGELAGAISVFYKDGVQEPAVSDMPTWRPSAPSRWTMPLCSVPRPRVSAE